MKNMAKWGLSHLLYLSLSLFYKMSYDISWCYGIYWYGNCFLFHVPLQVFSAALVFQAFMAYN